MTAVVLGRPYGRRPLLERPALRTGETVDERLDAIVNTCVGCRRRT
jgi:hypothetical protein